ncbi:MAG: TolC family protein, partial [Pseudomonadota bacterium]
MRCAALGFALLASSALTSQAQTTLTLFEEEVELTATQLTSSDPSQAVCLPIADAMRAAAIASPDVAVAEAQIAGSKADLSLARSLTRPQVSTFARTQAGDGGLTGNAIDNQVGFRASQRIWDFGDARFAREAAQSRVGAAEQTQLSIEAEAERRVALSYITALEAYERKRVTSEREDYFRRQLSALQAALE